MNSRPYARATTYAETGPLASDVEFSPCDAIRCGVGGDLKVRLALDGYPVVTIPSVQTGETIEIQAAAIVAIGTTAEKITVFHY